MLAHAMKGDEPAREAATGPWEHGFPRSRLMRALSGPRGRMLLGAGALAVTLLRPKLLRPLVMRYLLPRLLGQR